MRTTSLKHPTPSSTPNTSVSTTSNPISSVFTPITTGTSDDQSTHTDTSGITLASVHEIQRKTLTALTRMLERLPEAGTGMAAPPEKTGQVSNVNIAGEGQ